MNLLILNYEMNDASPVLAWQAAIARELSLHCRKVVVLTESVGPFNGRPNMLVGQVRHNPGAFFPEQGFGGIFDSDVSKLLRKTHIDACFIHMAHKWAFRFFPIFFTLQIPTLLWYAHGTVTAHLRRALDSATRVVTSTSEGFRISSDKVHVIGQGINTALFTIPEFSPSRNDILYTGRITRRKRIGLMLEALHVLRARGRQDLRLILVGPLLTANDRAYHEELIGMVRRLGLENNVIFAGSVVQEQHLQLYRNAFLHLNVSETGSMDKTVLEALACGCPVLTSNPAFRDMLSGPYPEFLLTNTDPGAIADRIIEFHQSSRSYSPQALRSLIVGQHDQTGYAKRIFRHLQELHEQNSARNGYISA